MDFSDDGIGVEPLSLKKLAHTEMTNALSAIKTAREISAAQSRREIFTVEDLTSLLSKSTEQDLARKALKGNRLVYLVDNDGLVIIACRHHYG